MLYEIDKPRVLSQLAFLLDLFENASPAVIGLYRQRATTETLYELRRHPNATGDTLFAAFCFQRRAEITDSLMELLLQIIRRIGARAEKRITKGLLDELRGVTNKPRLLYQVAEAALAPPDETIRKEIFRVMSEEQCKAIIQEYKTTCRHYLHQEHLRAAVVNIANAIFQVRLPHIWGEGTTTCASDLTQFGAWDQNLLTEWHLRYGGKRVVVYWHVERRATCIYSQLKTGSSSEVAAMISGVLRHCTEMKVEKQFVDTHGQNEVAFGFCHLLGFQLMPRLKNIYVQRLARPETGKPETYPNFQLILSKPIDWNLIQKQYDQMIKYATALRLGTAETEAILRRFTEIGVRHPTYRAFAELGRTIKTIFLCQYLHSEDPRREIHEGFNVIENWNGANSFIFYGSSGDFATNRIDEQELAALSLHLRQICLVYMNTLLIQQVLADPKHLQQMKKEDFWALTPLIYAQHYSLWNISPGSFREHPDRKSSFSLGESAFK